MPDSKLRGARFTCLVPREWEMGGRQGIVNGAATGCVHLR
jgi:hypothetical protein